MSREFLLKMMPKESICAEIGVAHGNFSQKILNVVKPKKLYLVDPWTYDATAEAANRFYGGKARTQQRMDDIAAGVAKRFETSPNVDIQRIRSDSFFTITSNQYLDWVYIDGNHDFGPCLVDILLSINKVKVGGFVTGDDVGWGDKHLNKPVLRAVKVVMEHEPRLKIVQVNNKNFPGNQFIFKRVK